jgi:hypothetical protein
MTEGPASLVGRLWPKQLDNRFVGYRAALWLLGAYVAVKLAMSLSSIFNTAAVAGGADGIPLDSFGPAAAREVLTLFALVGLGQLTLAVLAASALVRYRAIVPLMFLTLLGEGVARRLIVQSSEPVRTVAGSGGFWINIGLLALLALGLVLSLLPRKDRPIPS